VATWKLQQEGVIDQETQSILKADDTLTRWYTSPEGGANLFIAYFKTQRQGQSPHSPKNCLPGSGWQPSETGRIDVPVGGNGSIHINQYVVSKGEAQSVVLYWYQTQGRVIADEFAAKFYLISDSIRNHRSDTALVRVVVPIAAGRTQEAEKVGTDFVQVFYPVVKAYLPR
jgi:EpsI family protein